MTTETRVRPHFCPDLRNAVRVNKARLRPDRNWPYYNSEPSSYDKDFKEAFRGKTLQGVIASFTDPVVIDLMAPSGTLAGVFKNIPGEGKLGIAVSLEDIRTDEVKARDQGLGIEQVEGDVTKGSTWRKIENHLAGRKADLIIERAFGGLDCIPEDPFFYAYCLQRMWSFLNPNHGMMVLSMPSRVRGVDPKAWVKRLKEIGIAADIPDAVGSVLRIIRASHNPDFLPFNIAVNMTNSYFVGKPTNNSQFKSHRGDIIPFLDRKNVENPEGSILKFIIPNSFNGISISDSEPKPTLSSLFHTTQNIFSDFGVQTVTTENSTPDARSHTSLPSLTGWKALLQKASDKK